MKSLLLMKSRLLVKMPLLVKSRHVYQQICLVMKFAQGDAATLPSLIEESSIRMKFKVSQTSLERMRMYSHIYQPENTYKAEELSNYSLWLFRIPPVMYDQNSTSVIMFVTFNGNDNVMSPHFIEINLRISLAMNMKILNYAMLSWIHRKMCLYETLRQRRNNKVRIQVRRKIIFFLSKTIWPNCYPNLD